jgi:endoglucanase
MDTSEYLSDDTLETRHLLGTRVIKNMAAAALLLQLVACSSEEGPKKLPERNAPTTAEYTLDTSTTFRNDVDTMSAMTNETEIIKNLENLQNTAVAEWLYEDSEIVENALTSTLEKGRETMTIPQLVLYNLPDRDLDNHSAGGADNSDVYINWVEKISETIASQPTVIVVEPDAIPLTESMDVPARQERIRTLAKTLDTLSVNKNTAVYLDLGNSDWLSPQIAAQLLREVNEQSQSDIRGISLNVANYHSEEDTRVYAAAIEKEYGERLFVLIDNSRNGPPAKVKDGVWCNPEGQTLGEVDPLFDARQAVETAYIKTPGQSDGVCGISQKPAGEFDSHLLLDQLR